MNQQVHISGLSRPSIHIDLAQCYDYLRLCELSNSDSDYDIQLECGKSGYIFERVIRTHQKEGGYVSKMLHGDKKHETSALIFRKDDELVVSFRGTKIRNRSHWLRNIKAKQMESPLGGKVHQGFNETLSWPVEESYDTKKPPLWDAIKSALAEIKVAHPECQHITFTGHSAGAAMATIAAARYFSSPAANGLMPQKLISFASPRTGNKIFAEILTARFADVLDSQMLRFVLDRDVIPQFPPKSTKETEASYKHVGTPIVIVPNKQSLVSPGSVSEYQRVNASVVVADTPPEKAAYAPHQFKHYMAAFESLLSRDHKWVDRLKTDVARKNPSLM